MACTWAYVEIHVKAMVLLRGCVDGVVPLSSGIKATRLVCLYNRHVERT